MFEGIYRLLEGFGYTHPIHPTQVIMPIGLAVGAFIIGIAAWITRRADFHRAAKYAVLLAFLFLFSTAVTGFMDWQHFYGGAWLFEIRAKIALALLFFLLLITAVLLARRKEKMTGGVMTLYGAAFLTAVSLGYFGGEILFKNWAPEAPPEFKEGEIVFRGNCSGCHSYGGNILEPGEPLIGSHMLGESGAFIKWIRNPADPMPEFPADDIPDAQAESLYKYINAVWGKPGEDEHKHSKETRDHSDAEADQAGTRVGMPDLKFDPGQVSIKAGESVRWENTSDVVHTVTADRDKARDPEHVVLPDGAKPFDSGDLRPGETFTYRFEVPGLYRYFCIPHEMAGMIGEVEVEQ